LDDVCQTWHHGLVAKWRSEFNDDFRPHEVPYFQRYIERALDVACGTAVYCCPTSARGWLAREGAGESLSPNLFVQVHELDLPRRYKTIFVCGAFGPGPNGEGWKIINALWHLT
jgi:hypothetical protein